MTPIIEYISRKKLISQSFKLPSSVVLITKDENRICVGVIKKHKKKILFNIYDIFIKAEEPKLIYSITFDSIDCLLSADGLFKELPYSVLEYSFPKWPIIALYNDPPLSTRQEKMSSFYFDNLLCSKSHETKRKNLVWNSFIINNYYGKHYKSAISIAKKTMTSISIVGLSQYSILPYVSLKRESVELWQQWSNWNKILKLNKNNNPANEIVFYNIIGN